MPRQPQLLQKDEIRFAENLAISANAVHSRNPAIGDPVTVFVSDPVGSEVAPHSDPFAERIPFADKGWVFAFQRLQIVIASAQMTSRERIVSQDAVSTDAAEIDPREAWCGSEATPTHAERAGCAPVPEQAPDPVIGWLSDALEAAERACDQHSTIYADAIRLAIAIRSLGGLEARRFVPDDLGEQVSVTRPARALQKWRLKRVLEYIDNHLHRKITLDDLAAVAGLSRMHFASRFRAAMGLRPHEYLLRQRIGRAEELLLHSTMPIVEIALTVGFQTQAHFTTVFKRFMGHTPCQWRNAHHAEQPAAQQVRAAAREVSDVASKRMWSAAISPTKPA